MSEAASTRIARRRHAPCPPRRAAHRLARPAAARLAARAALVRGQGPRRSAGFRTGSAGTELLPWPGSGPLGPARTRRLGAVGAAAPAGDCYQLLLGVRPAAAARARARADRPRRGRPATPAGRSTRRLHDPRLADVLLERLRYPGALGPLRFDRDRRADPGRAAPAAARRRAVQLLAGLRRRATSSRSSAGSSPGANPDLELPLALAGAGLRPGAGAGRLVRGRADPRAAGTADPGRAPAVPARLARTAGSSRCAALGDGGDFTAEAHALGRATAEVHSALAAALPTVHARAGSRRPGSPPAMTERLDATARAVPALRPYVPGLRAAFDALAALDAAGAGQCPPSGSTATCTWARPCAPRTAAGRSSTSRASRPGRWPSAAARSRRCATSPACCAPSTTRPARTGRGARTGRRAAGRRSARATPQAAGTDPRDEPELLRAYETDKAVYEVRVRGPAPPRLAARPDGGDRPAGRVAVLT